MRSPFTPPSRPDSTLDALRDATVLTGVIVVIAGHRLQCGRNVPYRAPSALRDPTGLSCETDREVRHQSERRLQHDHAAIGSGQPDETALIAAE